MTSPKTVRLAAYQPDIAPNLGSMIRLSACMGVPLDIIEPCGFPLSVKSLKRTAMDYAEIADMTRHTSWEKFRSHNPNKRLVLMTTKAEDVIWDFEFEADDIIIMGRESAGVPIDVHEVVDARIKLPLFGAARSLNVATCAAMALSEAQRQLRKIHS